MDDGPVKAINSPKSFTTLLDGCMANNGHSCPGQVLGVRMAVLGLQLVGIRDPKGRDRKSILVIVEQDRCATDAIQYVTGCSVGKRTLRLLDYGKMAATFVNLRSNTAVRIYAREESREQARAYFPDITDKYTAQAMAYRIMSDDELFTVMEVTLRLPDGGRPVKTSARVVCECCGEHVEDEKQVVKEGRMLCRSCSEGLYYAVESTLTVSASAKAAETG